MPRLHSCVRWFWSVLGARRLYWFTAVIVVLGTAQGSLASEVVLVLSSEAGPFQQAGQAAVDRLQREGYKTTSRVLEDDRERDEQWLRNAQADAYLAIGSKAARLVQHTLPPEAKITYCMVTDPESLGLIERGAVGVSADVPIESQFELIAEALPRARKIGMLYRSDRPRSQRIRDRTQEALPGHGWRLEAVAINEHASTAEAIDALLSRQIDIVWTAPDSSVFDSATVRSLLLGSVRRRVPVFGFSASFVRAGALLGVSITPQRQGERAGDLTAELIKRRQSEVDFGRVTTPNFNVSVNLIVAEAINIDLPRSLVDRAQTVIRQE